MNLLIKPIIALVLICLSIAIEHFALWSQISNWIIPWTLSSLAIAVIILAIHEVIIPLKYKSKHWLLFWLIVLTCSVGEFTDSYSFRGTIDLVTFYNWFEVFGFSLIYALLLHLMLLQNEDISKE